MSASSKSIALELRNIETLLVVAETGSFRKAASRDGIAQSAVSRRVRRVEDFLGVSMFERRPSGVRLTPAGAVFISQAKATLDDLKTAVERARDGGTAANGNLKIGIIASLSQGPLRNLFGAFMRAHKDVEIYVTEADRSELLTLLSHRRMDAVVAAGEPEPNNGDCLLLAREKIYLAIPTDHQWARRERLHWDSVREEKFIVGASEPGPEIHDYILRRISNLGRTAQVCRHRLGREGIMTLVGLGFGVSLVADHWRGAQYPNVTFVPIGKENETVPFVLPP